MDEKLLSTYAKATLERVENRTGKSDGYSLSKLMGILVLSLLSLMALGGCASTQRETNPSRALNRHENWRI